MLPAVIALGANLGDREANLRAAVRDIREVDGVTVTAVSGIVQSAALKPEGADAASPDYLNAVMLVDCALQPDDLLRELNRIEAEHGRERGARWADRTLDLDIVAFGRLGWETESLTLPHPRAWERPFVIVPWLEVDPDAEIGGRGRIDGLAAARSRDVRPFAAPPLGSRP